MKNLVGSAFLVTAVVVCVGMTVQAGDKVTICHVPPGNPANHHTITVSVNALQAHLDHGDLAGSCLTNCQELCGDEDACTVDCDLTTEACIAAPRPAVDCDDGAGCTVDSCDPASGCTYAPLVCPDEDDNACTVTPCIDSGGEPDCSFPPINVTDGEVCDDGDHDTTNDRCEAGICVGDPSGPCTPEEILFDEDFQADPGWTTMEPQNLRWDPAGFYRVRVNDDGNPRWAFSPSFDRIDNECFEIAFDVIPANMAWGTYPKIAFIVDSDSGLVDVAPESAVLLDVHWDDPYGKVFFLGLNGSYRPHSPFWNATTWYRHRVTYDASAETVEWVITERDSGIVFHQAEFTNVALRSFNQIAVGYYGPPDYGTWGEVYVDNFQVSGE